MTMDCTEDAMMGGRIILRQPAKGYRAAIDPLLLAAAIPAIPGQTILDVGCGVGTAFLCLNRRVAGCRTVGLEAQDDLARLAATNISLNGMENLAAVVRADLRAAPFPPASFDHVMTNPPYHKGGTLSPQNGKAMANTEADLPLADWIKKSAALLRPKGTLTVIHRADRLDDLLAALRGRIGDLQIIPLWPKAGQPAKRLLIRGRKGVRTPPTLACGLRLHEADGVFSAEANAVLRDGASIP